MYKLLVDNLSGFVFTVNSCTQKYECYWDLTSAVCVNVSSIWLICISAPSSLSLPLPHETSDMLFVLFIALKTAAAKAFIGTTFYQINPLCGLSRVAGPLFFFFFSFFFWKHIAVEFLFKCCEHHKSAFRKTALSSDVVVLQAVRQPHLCVTRQHWGEGENMHFGNLDKQTFN